jgi:probable phosphoglycerate mutase
MIHVVLVRHGRTAWNVEEGRGERFRGTLDVPLAAEGVAQARVTAHHLAGWPLAAIYTSSLQRAARTAEIIAAPHHLVAQHLPGLRSMDYGEWAGQLHTDVAARWPDLYAAWRRDPFSTEIPGGERLADLRERAMIAVRRALSHHGDGETLAFITHQVVSKVLVCALAGLPDLAYWHVRQDLCSLSRFDYDPENGTFHVTTLNDTCHLTPALANSDGNGIRIVLLRHGQTAWNASAGEERFRGRKDLPLDRRGQAQARAVADWLSSEPLVALYSSPLQRARQTLQPLASDQGLPVEVHEGLIDIDYGRFQGLTHVEARTTDPELYGLWRTAPSRVRFPGGEALADVQARLRAILAELAARHPGGTVVLTGHEMVNKVLACTLLGLDLDQIWRVRQDVAAISLFKQDGESWTTLGLNDTCHLADVEDDA